MADAREQAEFARIALPHLDAAYNLAHWLVRDAAAAEDVVQDAMLRALRYFASFRGDNPRAWLLQIVRNAAMTRIERTARSREQPLQAEAGGVHEHLADAAPDPEATMAHREDLSRLERMLGALPTDLRECVVLRELEEMSYRDIARVTGVPVGTVMSRLFRARQALLRLGQWQVARPHWTDRDWTNRKSARDGAMTGTVPSATACEEMRLLIQADLDGELDAAATAALAAHLADCPGCAELQRS